MNPAQWPVVPRRIPVAGHTVHAGWFTLEQDEHVVTVCSYAPRHLNLLVVPPQTAAVDAARLMTEAADPESTRTASALLAAGTGGAAAQPKARSDFLPSAVTPADGLGEAGRRADLAQAPAMRSTLLDCRSGSLVFLAVDRSENWWSVRCARHVDQ